MSILSARTGETNRHPPLPTTRQPYKSNFRSIKTNKLSFFHILLGEIWWSCELSSLIPPLFHNKQTVMNQELIREGVAGVRVGFLHHANTVRKPYLHDNSIGCNMAAPSLWTHAEQSPELIALMRWLPFCYTSTILLQQIKTAWTQLLLSCVERPPQTVSLFFFPLSFQPQALHIWALALEIWIKSSFLLLLPNKRQPSWVFCYDCATLMMHRQQKWLVCIRLNGSKSS